MIDVQATLQEGIKLAQEASIHRAKREWEAAEQSYARAYLSLRACAELVEDTERKRIYYESAMNLAFAAGRWQDAVDCADAALLLHTDNSDARIRLQESKIAAMGFEGASHA